MAAVWPASAARAADSWIDGPRLAKAWGRGPELSMIWRRTRPWVFTSHLGFDIEATPRRGLGPLRRLLLPWPRHRRLVGLLFVLATRRRCAHRAALARASACLGNRALGGVAAWHAFARRAPGGACSCRCCSFRRLRATLPGHFLSGRERGRRRRYEGAARREVAVWLYAHLLRTAGAPECTSCTTVPPSTQSGRGANPADHTHALRPSRGSGVPVLCEASFLPCS